jgi:hypothetical protein
MLSHRRVALALGGKFRARLAGWLGLTTTLDTVLRHLPLPAEPI